ncbi:hypothetical protein [Janthinobacterium sp. YR213]|uniref:hypothetical protein n=1 Tax=Janthinobacterium sp. YR213 TaxID=1881027 RepID=UPI00087E9E41|nr:hypothetical protein [Janthinobacterium sp. YR213]SDG68928.1 hypothetical protein SAMN05428968_0338 [Janthinobacterium sp. YR213]
MKLLKIENGQGHYYTSAAAYQAVDKINKGDLLYLVNLALENEVEFDDYNEELLKNQAHQIVYKSLLEKLRDLTNRRREFRDEADQLFSKEYDKYAPATAD